MEGGRGTLKFVGDPQAFELLNRFFRWVFNHHQGETLVKMKPLKSVIVQHNEKSGVHDDEVLKDMTQDAPILHGLENSPRLWSGEDLPDFHPPSFDRHHAQAGAVASDGLLKFSVHGPQRAAVPSGKPVGSEDSECIFLAALTGIADRSNKALLEVSQSVVRVVQSASGNIDGHAVEREVPATQILLQRTTPGDDIRAASVAIERFGTEGRHFVMPTLALHRDGAKINARGDGLLTEEFHHAVGRAGGAHVNVRGCLAKPCIANATADQPCAFACFRKGLQQAQ